VKILDDLLSTLNFDTVVKDVRQGVFQTAAVTRRCGLSATLHDPEVRCEDSPPVANAGSLIGKKARAVVELAYSSRLLEASLGMAAINSLVDVDENRCTQANARDILAQRGKGKKVALIGHFPFVTKLSPAVAELWVIEKRPRAGDFTEDEAERLLPRADVVGITGAAFTNHTIEDLLRLCRRDAYVIIIGPTTPLSPALFRYGVSALSGAVVDDTESVLSGVSQGATFRQLSGVRLLTMERDG